ncbi:unnamed protein product [Tilletia controversa]|nr:unnamed protein product [Tilletia controversa]
MGVEDLLNLANDHTAELEATPRSECTFGGLKRGPDGHYDDFQLAELIENGIEEPALAFGAHSMPVALKTIDKLGQLHARNVFLACTMVAAEWPELVTRKQMDEFAARSHNRATEALCEGRFADEIIPVTARKLERRKNDAGKEQLVENGKEEWATVSQDDGIRHGTTAESLGELKPAFPDWPPSRTTAGNASQVTDGGAAVVLMRRAVANKLGKCILAKYVSTAVSGLEPRIMGIGPALAVPKLLEQTGVAKEEVDLYEINEAFASMGVYCQNQLQIPDDKFNVNGGAIALGHPLGATGTRLVVTILNELARRDQQVGVVSMCIGLGMGAASLLIRERP